MLPTHVITVMKGKDEFLFVFDLILSLYQKCQHKRKKNIKCPKTEKTFVPFIPTTKEKPMKFIFGNVCSVHAYYIIFLFTHYLFCRNLSLSDFVLMPTLHISHVKWTHNTNNSNSVLCVHFSHKKVTHKHKLRKIKLEHKLQEKPHTGSSKHVKCVKCWLKMSQ